MRAPVIWPLDDQDVIESLPPLPELNYQQDGKSIRKEPRKGSVSQDVSVWDTATSFWAWVSTCDPHAIVPAKL